MPENTPENKPSSGIENMSPAEQAAAFSRFLQQEAEQRGEEAMQAKKRLHFPERPDDSKADKVAEMVAPKSKPASLDEAVEDFSDSAPASLRELQTGHEVGQAEKINLINRLLASGGRSAGKDVPTPHDLTVALAKLQESQEPRE